MEKNTVTAFILIAIIMLATQFIYSPEPDNVLDSEKQKIEKEELKSPQKDNSNLNIDDNSKDTIVSDGNNHVFENDVNVQDITVDTDLYKAIISSKDGIIKEMVLKNHFKKGSETEPLQLIPDNSSNLRTEISLLDGRVLKNLVFEANTTSIDLNNSNPEETLILTYTDQDGNVLITRTYTFYNDKYSFDVMYDNSGVFSQMSSDGIKIIWGDGLNLTEGENSGSFGSGETYYMATFCKIYDEEHEEFSRGEVETLSGEIEWASTRNKYFETFVASKSEMFDTFLSIDKTADVEPEIPAEDLVATEMGFELQLKKKNPVFEFLVYLGPIDADILGSYEKGFEATLDLGWDIVEPFAWVTLYMLKFFSNFISNYGVIIVLISLIVNFVILPFNIKSYKSSLAMKKIQPYLKEIREKYKGDFQMQQQKTMELYKKYKVNPFGACLPALLPMPMLFGMFVVLRSTIDIRNEGFMLWITDLSLPEVFFSLPFSIPFYGDNVGLMPIIMAVFMFLQMKDTMTDPNMKATLYMMPAFMLVIFNSMPSGLILYYMIGTIFRYIQQLYTKSREAKLA